MPKRLEIEMEKKREELEDEVARRVEEARKILEETLREEKEREQEEFLTIQKQKDVSEKTSAIYIF